MADRGFLKRGFMCIKVQGFALLNLSNFLIISHENEIIGLTETKLFLFHRIF